MHGSGSDPLPHVARIILDELLEDPRATAVIELAQNANELLASLRGHRAPPAPPAEPAAPEMPSGPTPRQRLLFGDADALTHDAIRKRRAALAALCHPDSGGDSNVMAALNAAADQLLSECVEKQERRGKR